MNQGSFPLPSLYVGDLHSDVNEAMLYEMFAKVGAVSSVNVCRDNVTKRSLGYAYVNYANSNDAERALETLNYAKIKDKPVRIMWSKRDPAARKSNVSNVFVKNLHPNTDNKILHDEFSKFGNISSCKLATTDQGLSKGYGYVHFETQEAAQEAVEKMSGQEILGEKISVEFFKSKKDRGQLDNFTNIYIKNLDESMTEEQLEELFSDYGIITSKHLQRDSEGKSTGVAFVNLESHEEAARAIEELSEKELDGRKIYVAKAQKKEQRERDLKDRFEKQKLERSKKFHNLNIYVKTLSDDMDDDGLRNMFAPYGTITSTRVMRDESGKSKGFGFVCFSKQEEAQKAITEMNGKVVEGKKLFVTLHQSKDIRKMHLEAQFNQRPGPNYRMPPQGQMPNSPYQPIYFQPQPNYMMPTTMMKGAQRWGGQPDMQQRIPNMVFGNKPQMPLQLNGKNRAFRFSSNARNREKMQQHPMQPGYSQYPGMPQMQMRMPEGVPGQQMRPPMVGPQVVAQQQQPVAGAGLNTAVLSSASSSHQKQMLGDSLFPKVFERNPELAGKITGMLLDMDNSELVNLLEDERALDARIQEAIEVLKDYKPEDEVGVIEQQPVPQEGEAQQGEEIKAEPEEEGENA